MKREVSCATCRHLVTDPMGAGQFSMYCRKQGPVEAGICPEFKSAAVERPVLTGGLQGPRFR